MLSRAAQSHGEKLPSLTKTHLHTGTVKVAVNADLIIHVCAMYYTTIAMCRYR